MATHNTGIAQLIQTANANNIALTHDPLTGAPITTYQVIVPDAASTLPAGVGFVNISLPVWIVTATGAVTDAPAAGTVDATKSIVTKFLKIPLYW